ncbi:MAG: hypothetical protein M1457_04495 [bacterium]|nr:hypothetical protein [bacterium]
MVVSVLVIEIAIVIETAWANIDYEHDYVHEHDNVHEHDYVHEHEHEHVNTCLVISGRYANA